MRGRDFLSAFFLLGAFPAICKTIVVDLGGGGDFTEIQPAIDVAADGDTVLVRPGRYVIKKPIEFHGKCLMLRSEAGPEATTICMAEDPA